MKSNFMTSSDLVTCLEIARSVLKEPAASSYFAHQMDMSDSEWKRLRQVINAFMNDQE